MASDELRDCSGIQPDAFDRAYLSERVPRLEAVLLKARNRSATLRVACLGGSYTTGQDCFSNLSLHRYLAKDPSCAWPKRLETHLTYSGWWFYAVGSVYDWKGGIPGTSLSTAALAVDFQVCMHTTLSLAAEHKVSAAA